MPATAISPDARFFIALNAGSGHSETEERRTTIETVLRDAGRQFELTIVDQPDTIDEIAGKLALSLIHI